MLLAVSAPSIQSSNRPNSASAQATCSSYSLRFRFNAAGVWPWEEVGDERFARLGGQHISREQPVDSLPIGHRR